ncbi:hypothetical protein VNO77_24973 [Canavalia gladiata]|uniref:Uncharacterized protein n=1 Tax=Canavalia gladiata TaxID=3824 RepID=A0AAN9LCH3_CANGL
MDFVLLLHFIKLYKPWPLHDIAVFDVNGRHIVYWKFAGPANYGLLLHYQSLVYQFQGDLLQERLKKAFYVCKVGFMVVISLRRKRLHSL